jgi:hypothetical protein
MVGDPEKPNPLKLTSISVQLMHLSELITAAQGEITPEIEAFMFDLSRQMKGTTDLHAFLLKRLEVEAKHFRSEAREYADKARRREDAAEKLKARIKNTMLAIGNKRLEGNRFGFSIKKSQDKVEILDSVFPSIEKRPDLWRAKTEYSIDKATVLSKLQKGEEIEGAKLEEVYALTTIDMIPIIEANTPQNLKGSSHE